MGRIGKSFLKAKLEKCEGSHCLNKSVAFHWAEALGVWSVLMGNNVGRRVSEYKVGRVCKYLAEK